MKPHDQIAWRSCIAATLVLCIAGYGFAGQQSRERSVPFRNRGVDLIILQNGTRLFGTVLPGESTRILLRRDWLASDLAEFVADEIEPLESAAPDDAPSPLEAAIEKEIERLAKVRPDDLQFAGLLRETKNRIHPTADAKPPWVLLTVPKDRVQRVQTQSRRARSVGYLGVLNLVNGVESSSWQDVMEKLSAIPESDRITDLPIEGVTKDPKQQLSRILAALDIRTGRTAKFIQVGNSLIPDDETAGIESVLPMLLSGTLQQQLGELLAPTGGQSGNSASLLTLPRLQEPPQSVLTELAGKDVRTIRMTAFGIDLSAASATVRVAIYSRQDDAEAKLICQTLTSANLSDVTTEQTQQIGADARIEQIASLFSGLGSSQADLTKAIQMGGTLRIALSRSEVKLQSQLDNILNGRDADRSAPQPQRLTLRHREDN